MEVQGFQGFVEEIDYNELEILEVCFLASGFLKIETGQTAAAIAVLNPTGLPEYRRSPDSSLLGLADDLITYIRSPKIRKQVVQR